MTEVEQQRILCDLCGSVAAQKKSLLYILFKTLSKQLAFITLKYSTIQQDTQSNGFSQIIQVIFKYHLHQINTNCHHIKIYNILIAKLNCSDTHFQFICKRVAERTAERNYHLEMLALQIKNSARSINNQWTNTKANQHLQQPLEQKNYALRKYSIKGDAREMCNQQKAEVEVEDKAQERNAGTISYEEGAATYMAMLGNEFHVAEGSSMNMQHMQCANNMTTLNSINSMSNMLDYNSMYCLPFTFIYNQSTSNHPN